MRGGFLRIAFGLGFAGLVVGCTSLLGSFEVSTDLDNLADAARAETSTGEGGTRTDSGPGPTTDGGDGGTVGPVLCNGVTCKANEFCKNNVCATQLAAGATCSATGDCGSGLTCLDGVCCTASTCGKCLNCGATGACDVKVGSERGQPDTTGTTCEGKAACDGTNACKSVLGQTCNGDAECISGHCVDKVCCGSATCNDCESCSATGACDIKLGSAVGVEDPTSTCNGLKACDAKSQCQTRWKLVATDPNKTLGSGTTFVTQAGGAIFYASPSNVGTPIFRSYNLATTSFADEAQEGEDFCQCGQITSLLPVKDKLYYLGSLGLSYKPGAAKWLEDVKSYTAARLRHFPATAAIGPKIYRVGGQASPTVTTPLASVQIYDVTLGLWTGDAGGPAAVPDLTTTITNGCAASSGANLYVFGGSTDQMYLLNTSNPLAQWVPVTPAPPARCQRESSLPTPKGFASILGGNVWLFDSTSAAWSGPITFPSTVLTANWRIVTDDSGKLYAIGNAGANIEIYQYQF